LSENIEGGKKESKEFTSRKFTSIKKNKKIFVNNFFYYLGCGKFYHN